MNNIQNESCMYRIHCLRRLVPLVQIQSGAPYGRWYYGHDHTEGCTRGGNRGGGGII